MTDASTNQFVRKMMNIIWKFHINYFDTKSRGKWYIFLPLIIKWFFFQIKIFLKVIFLSFPFGIIITKVKMFSVFFWLWYLINSHLCILIIKNIGIPSFIQSFRQYACEQSTVFLRDKGNIFWIHLKCVIMFLTF